jgi:hypothetical protein
LAKANAPVLRGPASSDRRKAEAELNVYEIRIEGHLSPRRFRRFDDLTVARHPSGETIIAGPIPDQAALFGLLNWLHDLGAVLVSVRRSEDNDKMPGRELDS